MTTPTDMSANATTNATANAGAMASQAVPAQVPSFLERLANQMGMRAGTTSIVGAPIERDGVTVVPVARASWGFGGGGGSQGENQGSGGGGGANVRPVGYIELKNGQASFHPVFDPNTILQLAGMVATAVALAMVLRVTTRLIRGK